MKQAKYLLSHLLLTTFLFFGQPAYAADYTNFIGMRFVKIPAGTFYMGSCKLSEANNEGNKKKEACISIAGTDSDAKDDETQQHKVRISKAFYLGQYEVTFGQYKKFIADTGRDHLFTDDFMNYNSSGDNAPASYISWNDAQNFIKWLNKKEDGNFYRLPTEAEWEYAARAGTTTRYSWGNSASQVATFAWYSENAYDIDEYPQPVGKKKPNPWGLYDMHGNVWEWVQDWYDERYYRNSPSIDPKGPSSGRYRVHRGGGWYDPAEDLRSANRSRCLPGDHLGHVGFRLLRTSQ